MPMPEPDPRNVPGPFYVERACCLQCGIPWHYAPDLFGQDERESGCWVQRQPETADEQRRMLLVLQHQEVDCIHQLP
jgi:hypothetical protein